MAEPKRSMHDEDPRNTLYQQQVVAKNLQLSFVSWVVQ